MYADYYGPVSDLQENKTKNSRELQAKGGTSIQKRTTGIMWAKRQEVIFSVCQNKGHAQEPTSSVTKL